MYETRYVCTHHEHVSVRFTDGYIKDAGILRVVCREIKMANTRLGFRLEFVCICVFACVCGGGGDGEKVQMNLKRGQLRNEATHTLILPSVQQFRLQTKF